VPSAVRISTATLPLPLPQSIQEPPLPPNRDTSALLNGGVSSANQTSALMCPTSIQEAVGTVHAVGPFWVVPKECRPPLTKGP
jgi:hypothetical protein